MKSLNNYQILHKMKLFKQFKRDKFFDFFDEKMLKLPKKLKMTKFVLKICKKVKNNTIKFFTKKQLIQY
jgi:hypothetical protein